MVSGKNKFALWITPEVKAEVEATYRLDNCKSQSEFIEKAIRFYVGYLHAKNASAYLPRILTDVLEGSFTVFGTRLGKHLHKLEVEQNITNHIIAADTDIDLPTYEHLRARSVREVKQTNGQISFKDALIFQKSL